MSTRIPVIENILSANDRLANDNRARLDRARVFSINIMASPGAGKTSLIESTVKALSNNLQIAVIDGDIATSLDADRAASAGAVAIQINTGGECHLDAIMLKNALFQLDLTTIDLLIVENVGNLVCPANFRLGTHCDVMVASVPEGDDKPYKYPGSYQQIDLLLLNKIDLLPYVSFDLEFFERGLVPLNPGVKILQISCKTGDGLDAWYEWLSNKQKNFNQQMMR